MNGERKSLYFRIGNCNKIKCGCVLRRHGTTVIFFLSFQNKDFTFEQYYYEMRIMNIGNICDAVNNTCIDEK